MTLLNQKIIVSIEIAIDFHGLSFAFVGSMYKLLTRSLFFLLFVIELLFLSNVYANSEHLQESHEIPLRSIEKIFPDNCSELIGSCDYYLCRESKHPCSIDGYYIGFGYQYCKKSFTYLKREVSPKGRKWLVDTATCLQQKMEDFPSSLNCKEIHFQAIKTHDQCYSEASFCTLPMRDIGHIFKMIYPELGDVDILKEGIEVLKKCTGLR